jgi:UDP-glucose 4-epimerase
MKEETRLSPKSTYATAKLVGEEYCKAFNDKYRLQYTILRYFNVYGPRQDKRFVISRFIKRVSSNESIYIYGDGKQTRDFTHVDDAVNMTIIAAISNKTLSEAINIGTGVSTTINDLARIIAQSINFNNQVEQTHVDYDKTRPRSIEVFNRTADITKAKKLLNYQPKNHLDDGIKKLIELV